MRSVRELRTSEIVDPGDRQENTSKCHLTEVTRGGSFVERDVEICHPKTIQRLPSKNRSRCLVGVVEQTVDHSVLTQEGQSIPDLEPGPVDNETDELQSGFRKGYGR